jgi:glycerol kinase
MPFILSIDQGTSSTRCLLFDEKGDIVFQDQMEHKQYYPKAGYVEHDPIELWENTKKCILGSIPAQKMNLIVPKIVGLGITNQRETSLIWNKSTGLPYHNAIVWTDTRTAEICEKMAASDSNIERIVQSKTGLPLSAYPSASKIKYILDNVPNLRAEVKSGEGN